MGALAAIGAMAFTGRVGGGPAWEPSVTLTGAAFTAAELEPGIPGGKNPVSNANRIYMTASGGSLPGGTFWVGRIKGTEAKLVVDNTYASYTAAILVAIDNGTFSAAANTGSLYTLFTGLADVEHTVCIRTGHVAWGIDSIYFNKAGGNIMTLQGTDTYVTMPASADWVYPGVTNALGVAAGMTVANTANYTPSKTKTASYGGASNIGSAKIRGAFKRIWVGSNGADKPFTKVFVSKNGAAPTTVSITSPGTGGQCVEFSELDGDLATYYCWMDRAVTSGLTCFAGDAQHVDCGFKGQIHQFGDSITYGGSTTFVPGDVEVFRVAAAMGYVALTAGIPGQVLSATDTSVTGYLADLTVTSDDVAIMAIGRNNTGGAFDAAEIANYTSIINKLVTKGYGKIICRGILPSGTHSTTWSAENGSIESIVSGLGNPDVVFLDVSGLGTYSTLASDNIHPDAAGYTTIATYVEPLYRTILGL